jgi:hypothetical protein
MKIKNTFLYFFLLFNLTIEARKKNIKIKNNKKKYKKVFIKKKSKYKKIFQFNNIPIPPIKENNPDSLDEINVLANDIKILKETEIKKHEELNDITKLKKIKELKLENLQALLIDKNNELNKSINTTKDYNLSQNKKKNTDLEQSQNNNEEEHDTHEYKDDNLSQNKKKNTHLEQSRIEEKNNNEEENDTHESNESDEEENNVD